MAYDLEKCKHLVICLQINQRLFHEIITQLNDQNIRKQFELIIGDNQRVINQLNDELRQTVPTDDHNQHLIHNHNTDVTQQVLDPKERPSMATTGRTRRERSEQKKTCQWPGCGYETRFSANMSRHVSVHSGAKPYACDWPQCHKRYQLSGSLTAHKRTHLNLKPFACDWIGCDYRTNNRCSLPAHRRTHNGIKAFACDWPQCSVTCSTRTHLRDHRLIHTKDKPFKCDVCEQSFAKKSNMRAHKLSVHLGHKRIRHKNTTHEELN
ncbi:unnamed protein product [Medioppia subpectinata]|uniref:C2H2-type domain-containing protein n=1 Tax=Medioppia subpectinata TaxID=1979941 RepID=A0A7R9PUM2_9ACAR|nr:unnamed protein product [Medioppia subpectinata]CAG2101729.1 unnamed protein product [Medioppia subpectinata]